MKRNLNSSSTPNANIDLTSLLDVIFIFLFVLIIGNAKATKEAVREKEEVGAELNEVQEKMQELKEYCQDELKNREQEIIELETELYQKEFPDEAMMERLKEYEMLYKDIEIVTVYCNYDENNPPNRTLAIYTNGDNGESKIQGTPWSLNENNTVEIYKLFESELKGYIDQFADNEKLVVIRLNDERIEYRDHNEIIRIIEKIQDEYSNVY